LKFNYFFFDLGNTLTISYDLKKSIAETKFKNVEKEKMSIFAELFDSTLKNELESNVRSVNHKEIIEKLLIKSSIQIHENEIDEFIECFLNSYIKKCKIASYSIKVLDFLLSNKKTIALVSNVTGPKHIFDNHLRILKIEKYFKAVVWSSVIGYRKPAKEIFEYAIKLTNAKIIESIFIGDNEKADIIGANSVGMKTVLLVNNTFEISNSKADWVIRKKDFANFITDFV
jgi:HAD superfamily hydrolase (TIGR01509 family)